LWELLRIARLRSAMQGIGLGLVQLFVWSFCGVAFWSGGWLVGHGYMNFGDLVTVFGMMLFASLGLSLGLAAIPEFLKGRAASTRMQEIINRQPSIPFSGGRRLAKLEGSIEFRNVGFSYPSRDIPVLRNISFKINPGDTVAFVGESGSGKTTTFSLLEKFYLVTEGEILIDGVDIRDLDLVWLHRYMSIVSQEPVLFGTTIAENISYAVDGVTQYEIEQAAIAANAHNFIVDKPEKYNTMVGERGIQLSGGQKQRVAIARAVLMNPKILLLDEATSALDTESERLVQEALDRLMVGKTSLVIAHRLSTVRHAACIFVMDKGEIVGFGTHQSLLETNPTYQLLANRQLTKEDQHKVEVVEEVRTTLL